VAPDIAKAIRGVHAANYKKVTRLMRSKGVDIVMVDTDGNHTPITGLFLEGGVNRLTLPRLLRG